MIVRAFAVFVLPGHPKIVKIFGDSRMHIFKSVDFFK